MNIAQAILIFLIRIYRWVLSPTKDLFFGPSSRCRYSPSCSDYAMQAVRLHGTIGGSWLSVKRICRCHPWGGCGHDPVPSQPPFQISNFKFQIAATAKTPRYLISGARPSRPQQPRLCSPLRNPPGSVVNANPLRPGRPRSTLNTTHILRRRTSRISQTGS